MKIIARQRDYYDFAMSYGIDPNIRYDRNPETGVIDKDDRKKDFADRNPYSYLTLDNQKVSIYKGAAFICGNRINFWGTSDQEGKIWFNYNEMISKYKMKFRRSWFGINRDVEPDDYMFVNEKHNSPIVVYGVVPRYNYTDHLETSDASISGIVFDETQYTKDAPILQYLGIQNILSGDQIFQMIDVWISNKGSGKDVKIEDRYKIEQAGFDLKTSFRNMKR